VLCPACRLDDCARELSPAAGIDGAAAALSAACEADDERGWPEWPEPGVTALWEQMRDWAALTKWRVRRNFRQRASELLWLYDKRLQPGAVRRLVGADAELHLPTLASATAAAMAGGDGVGAWEELELAAARQLQPGGEGCVVKPINGAGGDHVRVFAAPHPPQADDTDGGGANAIQQAAAASAAAVETLLRAAREITAQAADSRTSWQINEAPRGVLLQPLYRSGVPAPGGLASAAVLQHAPLELKLHVFFGVVLGGTLHTHPWHLWVAGDTGCVHLLSAAARKGGARAWSKDYGAAPSPAALRRLREVLRSPAWPYIVERSREIAVTSGMDELRCD
jgi:hypothetical protein